MKQNLKLILPLIILLASILTACEISRSGDDADISETAPGIATSAAQSPVGAPPQAPTTAPPAAGQPADIDPAGRPAPPPPPADAVEPGKVLVKLEPQAAIQAQQAQQPAQKITTTGSPSLDQRLSEIGATNVESANAGPGPSANKFSAQGEPVGQLFFVSYDSGQDPEEVAGILSEDPAVQYSEPNYLAGVAGNPGTLPLRFEPNDPYYKFQWHFQNIQMPAAWDTSTGQDVIVSIVDTGIDFSASDLANTNRLPGYDFVNDDSDPTDDNKHGTHVAGTVAQSTNNNTGVAGMAYNARLLPVKVLGADGNGTYENIIKGIIYATDQGARVINMSLAGTNPSAGLLDAVRYAHSRGVILVAAAGNSNGPVAYPAAYDDYVVAVGAVRYDNTRARYSNFGPEIDLVAPGGDVQVDQNGDGYADGVLQQTLRSGGGHSYQFFEGTSMASPHVAGLAALLLARKPGASPAEIENVMAQTARKNLGPAHEYGAGLIQAALALDAIGPAPVTVTPTFPPSPTSTSTPQPATATFTPSPTPLPEPPTATPTFTPLPTLTGTPVPPLPTATFTPPPTVTASPTATSSSTPTGTFTPQPTATFMPSPTPTSPPLPAGELLKNGDFETDEAWVFGDTPVKGEYSAEMAQSGHRSVKLGITAGPDKYSFTSVWQQVSIPAEAQQVTLTAHTYPISQDQPGRDAQNIFILNHRFRIIKQLSRSLSNSQSWEARTYDLSDLRGQTIYVYFGVFNNGYGNRPTAMFVDNASLRWAR